MVRQLCGVFCTKTVLHMHTFEDGQHHTSMNIFAAILFGARQLWPSTTMVCTSFDDPDDVFADMHEDEADQQASFDPNEQEPDWEHLLPTAEDEANFEQWFESGVAANQTDRETEVHDVSLPLSAQQDLDNVDQHGIEISVRWDPYMDHDNESSTDTQEPKTPTPKRTQANGSDDAHMELQQLDITPPPPKRFRLRTKSSPKFVAKDDSPDSLDPNLSELHWLIKDHTGCQKSRDFFIKVRRPEVRTEHPTLKSAEVQAHLRKEWAAMGLDCQSEWIRQALAKHHGVRTNVPKKQWHKIEHARALAQENVLMEQASKCLYRRACMGTWNGNWLDDEPEFEKFRQGVTCNADIDTEECLQLTVVRSLIARFEAFLVLRCTKLGFEKWSFVFEVSTKSEDLGRLHMHA